MVTVRAVRELVISNKRVFFLVLNNNKLVNEII